MAAAAKRRELSREPVHKGGTYCSPWCGAGCTRASYEAEKEQANAICKALGPGWRVRLWENLGWHHEAISPCGHVRVSRQTIGARAFWARVGPAGDPSIEFDAHASTPGVAVRRAVRKARAEIARLQEMIQGLS